MIRITKTRLFLHTCMKWEKSYKRYMLHSATPREKLSLMLECTNEYDFYKLYTYGFNDRGGMFK